MQERSIGAVGYLVRRLLSALPVVFLVVSLVFLLLHLVPGDPVQQMLGEGARGADVEKMRQELGLDLPLREQYGRYMKGLLRGDLGHSWRFNAPVAQVIRSRYPATMELTLAALLVALLFSVPAGIHAAVHRGRWGDQTVGFFSLLGLSFPNFALGPVVILIFAIELGWLPVSGRGSLSHLVLPAVTLGAALAAILTRMVRSSLLEELGQA